MGIHGGVARRALAPLGCGQGLACPFRQCVRLHSAAEPTGAIPQAERPAHVPSVRPAVDQPAGSPAGMVLIANLLDAGGHRGGSADPPPRALERRLARRSGPGHSPDQRGPEPRHNPSPAGSPARDGRPGAHRPSARPPPLARGPALGRLLPDPKRGEPRGPPTWCSRRRTRGGPSPRSTSRTSFAGGTASRAARASGSRCRAGGSPVPPVSVSR